MIICSDEYKTVVCGIDGDECDDFSNCTTCHKAAEEQKDNNERELKAITTLQEKTKNGIKFAVNHANTILIVQSVDDVDKAINNKIVEKLEKRDYVDATEIEKIYPHFKTFCEKNNIGAPWYYLYKSDFPLVAVYQDKVIATAPRIQME